MTLRNLLFCFFMVMISVSCIREEAQCGSGYLVVYGGWRYIESEPEIDNESVTLTVKSDADITNLAPVFTLTPALLSLRLVVPLLILRRREPIR